MIFLWFFCDLNTYVASVSYMYSLYMYLISFQGNMHVNIQKNEATQLSQRVSIAYELIVSRIFRFNSFSSNLYVNLSWEKYHLKSLLLISQELIEDVINKLFPFFKSKRKKDFETFSELRRFWLYTISCFNLKK